jgi:hypothetical protein
METETISDADLTYEPWPIYRRRPLLLRPAVEIKPRLRRKTEGSRPCRCACGCRKEAATRNGRALPFCMDCYNNC